MIHGTPSRAVNKTSTSGRVSTTGKRSGRLARTTSLQPAGISSEHIPVEKEDRGQRLVLGRGADVALDRERGEKLRDLWRAHLRRMPLVMKENEAPDPADVCFIGAGTIVSGANGLVDLIEEPGFVQRRRRNRQPAGGAFVGCGSRRGSWAEGPAGNLCPDHACSSLNCARRYRAGPPAGKG